MGGAGNNKLARSVMQLLVSRFFTQDPVYGKGKLGEIQGLVLGMLDTFNYEQVSCMHFCSVHP